MPIGRNGDYVDMRACVGHLDRWSITFTINITISYNQLDCDDYISIPTAYPRRVCMLVLSVGPLDKRSIEAQCIHMCEVMLVGT